MGGAVCPAQVRCGLVQCLWRRRTPLNITTGRTHEGAVLVAGTGMVSSCATCIKCISAPHARQRIAPTPSNGAPVGAVMMASSGCKAGYPQLVHRRHGNLRRLLFPCHNWPAASLDHLVGNRGMLGQLPV